MAFSPTSADIELNAGEKARRDLPAIEAQRQPRTHYSSWRIRVLGTDR
jgi:hypothetical protein